MLKKIVFEKFRFLLMVLITNICFVIPSCSKPHILIHNFKSISKSDINTLHDSKYILRIVTNNDEKDSHDLLHYPKSDKLIRVDDYEDDSYVFYVKNNQLEIISTHSFGFNSTALVFLLNFNQTDGIMMIRNTEWNVDYEDSAVPIIYGIEKCD